VAIFRGIDDSDSLRWEPVTRAATAHEEERRSTRSGRLGSGTLACARCDAPVALSGTASPTDILSCPFCRHRAPLRDFLSLAPPSRPARVEVRVVVPAVASRRSRWIARTR
jgi:hypothetical protein